MTNIINKPMTNSNYQLPITNYQLPILQILVIGD